MRIVGDVDGDGDPDIAGVLGFGGVQGLAVSLNEDGAFIAGPVHPEGTSTATAIELADVDRDGLPDALLGRSFGAGPARLTLHLNTGGGSFVEQGTFIARSNDGCADRTRDCGHRWRWSARCRLPGQ